jgi:SMC interacting uncharacterized protein involved in chromosome segregation
MTKFDWIILTVVLVSSGAIVCWLERQRAKLETQLNTILLEIHQHLESVDTRVARDIQRARLVVDAGVSKIIDEANTAKADIKNHIVDRLEEHKADLKQNADRLRAHAQQMHDETQARHASRVVPTRS